MRLLPTFLPAMRIPYPPPHAVAVRQAFTLVELVVIVLILGIITAVAASKSPLIKRQTQINATVTQVRNFHTLAQTFHAKNGRWPNDAGPGRFPADFTGILSPNDFKRPPGIGGKWDWNGPGTTSPYYGFAVLFESAAEVPTDLITQLDAEYDDGSLTSGHIQLVNFGSRRGLQFILVPRS